MNETFIACGTHNVGNKHNKVLFSSCET